MEATVANQKTEFEVVPGDTATTLDNFAEAAQRALTAYFFDFPVERYDSSYRDSIDHFLLDRVADEYLEAVRQWLQVGSLPEGVEQPSHIAQEAIRSEFEGRDTFHLDYLHNVLKSEFFYDDFKRTAVKAVMESLPHLKQDVAEDLVANDFEDQLDEMMLEAMIATDPSTPLDILKQHDMVEVCYVVGGQESPDIVDCQTSHFDQVHDIDTVSPDANFAAFLRFVNVSSDHYKALVKEETSEDLETAPGLEEYEVPTSKRLREYRHQHDLQRAQMWKSLDVKADSSRPALLDDKTLLEVIENASYGGASVYAMRIPAKELFEFFDGDEPRNMLVSKGGEIGLHNFLNGSGYIVRPNVDGVELDLSQGALVATGVGAMRNGIDVVYGIVPSYHEVSIDIGSPVRTQDPETAPAP